jgi:RimJ/RimL family protein N-acetyltransferase
MPPPTAIPTLEGPRLRLRPWRDADLAPLAALNGDPAVMRHFLKPLSREESDAWAARMCRHFEAHGWGFWPVELPGTAAFIGVVGLIHVAFEAPFAPAVEIGWRLAPAHQGRGYAEEAARLALAYGFGPLGLASIVAFTPPANMRSWRLMERLGLVRESLFDHPRLPEGHPLRPHLLYRITRDAWVAQRFGGIAQSPA